MAANKYIANIAGALTEVHATVTSAGAADAGEIVALDAAGKLDTSMMPVGLGADTASVVSSENLAAGDLVNIWDNAGAFRVRKADATTAGKEAHGFVLDSFTAPAAATVYFEGSDTSVTGRSPGLQFLSTTAGISTVTAPSAAGNIVQRVGFATSATVLNIQSQVPVTLA